MVIVDWINLAQNRNKLRSLVHKLMDLHVPQIEGNFLTS